MKHLGFYHDFRNLAVLLFAFVLALIISVAAATPVHAAASPPKSTAESISTADDDSPTTISEIGRFRITVPGVGEPEPAKPFRPVLVADALVISSDRVAVTFQVAEGDQNAPTNVSVKIVGTDEEATDPLAITKSASTASFGDDGKATLVIAVPTARDDRELDIVWVGWK